MIWAILGNSNAGKTYMEGRFESALHFPVHFLRIIASRKDRDKYRDFKKIECHFEPKEFRIVNHQKGRGEWLVIKSLFNGSTVYQQDCDMDLVRYLAKSILDKWKDEDIVVEGEILQREGWLNIIKPDRMLLVLVNPELGVPKGVRKGKPWPLKRWTPERYLKNQFELLKVAEKWLSR